MTYYTRFVGLESHKDTIAIAVAKLGRGDAEYLGRIPNSEEAIGRWLNRKRRRWGSLDDVLMCYEAGPCGYALYRYLTARRVKCEVVAPGLTPKKPTDRIKTDRRDAMKLARLLRAGELTPIWVPDKAHEAFRTLLRAREAVVMDRTRARHQVSKLLLCRGVMPPEGTNAWTERHERWLNTLEWEDPSERLVFCEYRQRIRESADRVLRFEKHIQEAVQMTPYSSAIVALQCLRGFGLITSATVYAELGAVARFARPSQLMSYAGLVPGEYSSGTKTRRLSITKAGNSHLRRVLVEAAWQYRHAPYVSKALQRRQVGQPLEVLRISWKAQTRLNGRYRRLLGRGKEKNRVAVAIARELLGFVWEILQVVSVPEAQPLAA